MQPRLLYIKLTPKAAQNRIGEVRINADGQEVLQIYVTAPPDKNKANEALVRLLAEHLKLAPSSIRLVRGHTSRTKVLDVTD